eukprot:gene28368-37439_t
MKDDKYWLQALPLGNGLIGAMVYGGINLERIQLNEKSLWSGSVSESDNEKAPANLESIRNLLFAGSYVEAEVLTKKTQICKGRGSGFGKGSTVPFGTFQTLGDLWIENHNSLSPSEYSSYRKSLNIATALSKVTYVANETKYLREAFVSTSSNCLIVRLSSDRLGKVSVTISITRPERFSIRVRNTEIEMTGCLFDGVSVGSCGQGMHYMARVAVRVQGGTVRVEGEKIVIIAANSVEVIVTASTSYEPIHPHFNGKDYESLTSKYIKSALSLPYRVLREEHIREYRRLFHRVDFQLLNLTGQDEDIPTDKRLLNVQSGTPDIFLYQLYFHFGRYLLVSSMRENTLPANLQGI